jgi:hypothetical protein
MFIAILTLLSALSISGVAIFYSVIGLATIFPGAFWPVVIMGSVLEVGKLVTASWLYRNWQFTKWLLRIYLTLAVIILSAITSMGIFGFLSKAHLEQNLAEDTVTQRIEIITNKIAAENTYIERQKAVIERAESTLDRTTDSNTGALDIEIQSLKDAENKFKTLLAVETNTVKDLNDRLKMLDQNVSDVLTANKQFFNEEKAAAELKASQKEEREQIAADIMAAQNRIEILKDDYARSTANIQKRIDTLRQSNVTDNSGVNREITKAEANILSAQNRIDALILEREPLQSDMLKLEAEVGPVKYIAALAVDFGWTDSVNTSEAVRWVILIIIVVFDPLAVLLLIAANQSLIRRFPPEAPKPQEIIDLEKPDLDPPPAPKPTPKSDPAVEQWNSMIDKMNELAAKEREANDKKLEDTVKAWQQKLDTFNSKVDKPKPKEVEIVPVKDEDEKTSVSYDIGELVTNKKDDVVKVDYKIEEKSEPSISQQIEQEMLKERYKPDLTEVVENEAQMQDPKPTKKPTVGMLGQRIVDNKTKAVVTKKLDIPKTDFERTGLLNKLHKEHGNFQDISDDELKQERDQSNKARFLEDYPITEQDAKNHPPITKSRFSFFQDHIDDILRGDTLAENLPPEIAKTCAVLLSDYDNPQIIEPAMPNTAVQQTGLSTMTSSELKEKFSIEPETEDRDMTDEELEKLLENFEEDDLEEYDIVIKNGKKIKIPKQKYKQNEEQSKSNQWSKIKELDLPEPEKNELLLPDVKSTQDEDVSDIVDQIDVRSKLPADKIAKHKNKMLTDEQYRQKIEDRINDLITKIESNEIKIDDLAEEDQKVILDIMKEH